MTVDERDWLAERFEENRPHLRAVAYRMLGSLSEAEDGERSGGSGSGSAGAAHDGARLHDCGWKIVAIDAIADPERLRRLDLAVLND